MRKLKLLSIGLALATPVLTWAQGGIEGSPHDFSTNSCNTTTASGTNPGRGGVCSACHQAHHTDGAQLVPLWAHATSTENFTPYTSPTMNAAVGQPAGVSLACLSCHDGVTAVNAKLDGTTFTGGTAVLIDDSAKIGTDLHTTHPVSIVYDAALASSDGGLENPTTYKIGDPKIRLTVQTAPVPATWSGTSLTGKTINDAMLVGGKLECSSCHDVHKQEGSAPSSGILTRISGTDADKRGSLLCRTCHVK